MAITIRNIPEELLVEILRNLLKEDLKKARLVCTHWSTAGAKWMFQRVYFAPRKATMKTFANIAANPVFARNVKELIYDGRLFLPEVGNYATYSETFRAHMTGEYYTYDAFFKKALTDAERENADKIYQCSVWNSETIGAGDYKKGVGAENGEKYTMNVANSLVRYARLLDQQEIIFDEGADFKALCEGLVSFRNICKICARADFNNGHFSDDSMFDYYHLCGIGANIYRDAYTDAHEWYSRRSNLEFGLTVPPAEWCRWPRSEDQELGTQRVNGEWDVRGMQSLFRAISKQRPRLEKLRIGSVKSQAPMTVFQMTSIDTERLRKTFLSLTTLKLHLNATMSEYGPEYEKLRHRLDLLLQEAKNLRILSSSGCFPDGELDDPTFGPVYPESSHCFDFDMFLGKQWPYLTKLSLKNAWVNAEDLISVLRAHSVSLRDVRLVNLAFGDEENWDHLGKEMGRFLRLHCVRVYRLMEDVNGVTFGRWMREDLGPVLVRHIMQWLSPSLLVIEERYGVATGRLKAGAP